MQASPELLRVIGGAAIAPVLPALGPALDSLGESPGFRWLGHAGVSLDWAGNCVVFDPVVTRRIALFFDRALPVVLPHRRPDLVILSHTHRDHFHGPSLALLQPRAVVLPRGTKHYLPALQNCTVVETDAGEVVEVGGFCIRAWRMRHPGWRQPLSPSYPALGYTVVRAGFSVFHAGDTAASPAFDVIGAEAPPDIALFPIGAYAPRFVLHDKHLNPEEAVAAALAVRARLTIPLHFGTFRLSFEPLSEPLPRFAHEAARRDLPWCVPWATPSGGG